MKKSAFFLGMTAAFLSACGGSGGGSHTADTPAPPDVKPPQDLPPAAGQVQAPRSTLGELRIAPTRAERPDAATWTQLNTAIATTNRLRAEVGQPPLALDENLAAYAAVRAKESATLFEHVRPNGQSALEPTLFVGYGSVGENLAAGYASPEYTVATQWRNSPGHYRNIIQSKFNRIGMGYHNANDSYRHYWTQIFAGNGDRTSVFRFITPLDRQSVEATIDSAVRYDDAHQLHIQIPVRDPQDSLSRLGRIGIFNAPHIRDINADHRLILRPHRAAGWSYQTFGEIADSGGIPEAYLNIGKPFIPDNANTLRATYRGNAIGDLGQHSRVIADVSADVDFSAGQKMLALQLYNSQRAQRDLESEQSLYFSHDPGLDFRDTLQWNGSRGQFESSTGSARLYGPDAAELGGQFQRQLGTQSYRGAYGAKRTQ